MEMLKNVANYERSKTRKNSVKFGKHNHFLPRKIIVNNIEINEDKRIANKFNNFFIDIDPEQQKRLEDLQDLSKTMYQNLTQLCPLDQLLLMN